MKTKNILKCGSCILALCLFAVGGFYFMDSWYQKAVTIDHNAEKTQSDGGALAMGSRSFAGTSRKFAQVSNKECAMENFAVNREGFYEICDHEIVSMRTFSNEEATMPTVRTNQGTKDDFMITFVAHPKDNNAENAFVLYTSQYLELGIAKREVQIRQKKNSYEMSIEDAAKGQVFHKTLAFDPKNTEEGIALGFGSENEELVVIAGGEKIYTTIKAFNNKQAFFYLDRKDEKITQVNISNTEDEK